MEWLESKQSLPCPGKVSGSSRDEDNIYLPAKNWQPHLENKWERQGSTGAHESSKIPKPHAIEKVIVGKEHIITNLLEVPMDKSYCPESIPAPWTYWLCQESVPYKQIFIGHFLNPSRSDILLQALHDGICVAIEEILGEIDTSQKLLVPIVIEGINFIISKCTLVCTNSNGQNSAEKGSLLYLSSFFEVATSVCTDECGMVIIWLSSIQYIACPQMQPIWRRLVTRIR